MENWNTPAGSYNLSNRELKQHTKVKAENSVNETSHVSTAQIIDVNPYNSTKILQGLGLILFVMVLMGFYGN
jgi:hypothetical protein